jgi:hypothetical protein
VAALEALAVRKWPVVFDLYFAPEEGGLTPLTAGGG